MTIKPTHIVKSTGAAVFPQGYDPEDLEEIINLQEYWEQAEKNTKTIAMRLIRNTLLDESDKKIMIDRPLNEQVRNAWYSYRQALRDLNFDNPDNIVWPIPPEN